MAKVSPLMGDGSSATGLDLQSIAAGTADPREMLDKLIAPLKGGIDELGLGKSGCGGERELGG